MFRITTSNNKSMTLTAIFCPKSEVARTKLTLARKPVLNLMPTEISTVDSQLRNQVLSII